jgi:hypothetical protein
MTSTDRRRMTAGTSGSAAGVNADLLAACKAARRIIIAAITANVVDLPEFDPAQHFVIVQIDAAIASAMKLETVR